MESLNIPSSLDWFSGLLASLTTAIVAGIIVETVSGRITFRRGATFTVCSLMSFAAILLFRYNAVGSFYYSSAKSIETDKGCAAAFPMYRQAISWNPKIVSARTGFVNCAIALGRPADAISTLEPLRETLATEWHYWYEVGSLYYIMDNYEMTANSVQRYAQLNPKDTKWIDDMGVGLVRHCRYAEAEAILRVVRLSNGEDDDALFWLAWALYEQDKHDDALRHFETCIQRFAGGYPLGRCHTGRGLVLRAQGHLYEAKTEFETALQIYPDQDDARIALSQLP